MEKLRDVPLSPSIAMGVSAKCPLCSLYCASLLNSLAKKKQLLSRAVIVIPLNTEFNC
jgi:hypothetical protein